MLKGALKVQFHACDEYINVKLISITWLLSSLTYYFIFTFKLTLSRDDCQVEDTDMELPKIYEPIESFKALEERLKYFLDQYNDIIRGSDMDLVFFPDAVIHLIKISRVIRNPGGNMMLVGVGGSGAVSAAVIMQNHSSFQSYIKCIVFCLSRIFRS